MDDNINCSEIKILNSVISNFVSEFHNLCHHKTSYKKFFGN